MPINKPINPRPILHLKTEPQRRRSRTRRRRQNSEPGAARQDQHRWIRRAITQDRLVRFTFTDGTELDAVIVNSGRFSIELADGSTLFKHALRMMKMIDAPGAEGG